MLIVETRRLHQLLRQATMTEGQTLSENGDVSTVTLRLHL